jgi:hypothetical protein
VKYAIRIPANDSLERDIGELLTRPVGRPGHKPVVWAAAPWATFGFGRARYRVATVVAVGAAGATWADCARTALEPMRIRHRGRKAVIV